MKRLILLLIIFSCTITFSQRREERFKEAREKIEQLEKIKLIETLKMDEQTTLKFFTRRTEFMDNLKKLNENQDDILDKLDEATNSNKDQNDAYFQNMIDQYFDIEQKIFESRKSFVNSLSDILTKEQRAKLLVFQRTFRHEVRDILFKGGGGPPTRH